MFVHITALERAGLRSLKDGQPVTFDIEAGRDGREIRDQPGAGVSLLGGGSPPPPIPISSSS